jgi:hypothetical protein
LLVSVDSKRCVVLVPYLTHVEAPCEQGLRDLERMGLQVRRIASSAAIDRQRCDMATQALADGFERIMWIDSDVGFSAAAVEQLIRHDLPVVAGLYPKKGQRAFAVYFEESTKEIALGEGGGLVDVKYVGTGFLLAHRMVYDDIQRTFGLPVCNTKWGQPTVPYFLPMVIPDGANGWWYLGEDFSFCERARQAGHRITVDTTIRLGHIGRYTYQWEDAGMEMPRIPRVTFEMASPTGDVEPKKP